MKQTPPRVLDVPTEVGVSLVSPIRIDLVPSLHALSERFALRSLSGELRIRDCGNQYDRYLQLRDTKLASVAAITLFQRMKEMGIETKDMLEHARLDEGASPVELKCLENCIFSYCCRAEVQPQ